LFTGSTIKHFTGKSLDKYPLLVPPLTEQHEIVRRVRSYFDMADRVERSLTKAVMDCERTAGAMLTKAFSGELN